MGIWLDDVPAQIATQTSLLTLSNILTYFYFILTIFIDFSQFH